LKEKVNVPFNPLLPAEYTPQWHNAVTSENENIWSIEAPIISSRRGLRTSHMNETKPWEAAVTQKVVVIKNKQTHETEMFVLSLIPDRKCFEKYRHHRGRTYTHVSDTKNFSGTAVYTLWEGTNVLIKEHNDTVVAETFRYNRELTFSVQHSFSFAAIGSSGDLVLMSDDPSSGCVIVNIEEADCIGNYSYCGWCGKLKGKCICTDSPPPGPVVPPSDPPSNPGGDGDNGYFPPNYQDPEGGPPTPTKYTVTVSTIGSGTVTGAGEYNAGDNVMLTAVRAMGYKFTGWQGDVTGTVNPFTITNIQKNYNVTANFVFIPPTNQAVEDCTTNNYQNTQNRNAVNNTFDLFGQATSDSIGSYAFNTYADFLSKVANNPSIEYSTTLVRGSYGLRFTEIQSSNSGTSTPIARSPDMVTTVHNHPEPNIPSAGDVFTTAKLVKDGYSQFESSITYYPGSDPDLAYYYVLYIEDRGKAVTFYNNCNSELDTDGSFKIDGDIFKYMMANGGSFSNLPTNTDEQYIYLLTAALKNFDSGIKLIKQTSDKKLTTYDTKEEPVTNYLIPTKCKK